MACAGFSLHRILGGSGRLCGALLPTRIGPFFFVRRARCGPERRIAYQIAMEAARRLGPNLAAIRRRDRDLDKQLRRATQSFVLNLAEGNRRRGQDRIHLFRVAAGSAAEVKAGLDLAVAWEYLGEAQAGPARDQLDQLLAVCWRLTERAGPRRRAG